MIRSLCAVFLSALAFASDGAGRLAPDGKRGFGADAPLAEILHPFRQPDDDERRFLIGLAALPGDIDTLAILARDRYRARGYFEMLAPGADADLAALHAAYGAAEADSVAVLAKRDARARAFARMYFDLRFLLRAFALDRYADERVELAKSLAVLRAATDGHVQLTETDARLLATRADLAASLLRAIHTDLQVLHVADPALDVESDTFLKADALIELSNARDKDREQAFALATRIEERTKRRDAMLESLAVRRLELRLAEALAARAHAKAEAAKWSAKASTYFEERKPGAQEPPELAKLSRPDRLRAARGFAAAALALDPIDEEATWILAKATDFAEGEQFSRQHFDRYLALRSIRAHEWATIRDRKLSRREQEALDVVQRSAAAPVR
jgi:hypothetical protein